MEVDQSKIASAPGPSEVKEKPQVDARVLLKQAEDNAKGSEVSFDFAIRKEMLTVAVFVCSVWGIVG